MARHDQLQAPGEGPDLMWSREHPPSRGQLATLAELACQLLGVPLDTRLDATVAITRLRLAAEEGGVPAPLRDVDEVLPF